MRYDGSICPMRGVAAIWVDEGDLVIHLIGDGNCGSELSTWGTGEPTVETPAAIGERVVVRVPSRWGEEVLSTLDRCGYVWALGPRFEPRTWAERLFAEVHPVHHDELLESLRVVLHDNADHRGLLEDAYRRRGE